jgi:hypothetical protein
MKREKVINNNALKAQKTNENQLLCVLELSCGNIPNFKLFS